MDPVPTLLTADHPPDAPLRVSARVVVPSLVATLLLVVAAVLLASVEPTVASAQLTPAAAALLVVLYAGFRQVSFEFGGVMTTAAQATLVPFWFAVDPAVLPLAVLGAELCARALLSVRSRDGWQAAVVRLAGSAATAWPVVGPALVITVAAPGPPAFADAPVYLAALAAQFAIEAFVVVAVPAAWRGGAEVSALALPIRGRLQPLMPTLKLNAALAPLGILAAVAMTESVVLVVSMAPLAVLLGHLAKERDERIVRAAELSSAYRGTAELMGDVLEADDAYTGGEHTEGVVELSLGVGRQLGLDEDSMRNLEFGALLHDIGKLRVPNEIINKPGKLDEEEWAIIKQHPRYGQEMLERVGGALSPVAPIVRGHHERWDGAGYPDGLKGEAIPIEARIITACDSFSAMTTNRSYRQAMSFLEAVEELERCAGSQFDPAVVAAMRVVVAEQAPPEAGSPLSEVGTAQSEDLAEASAPNGDAQAA